MFNSGVVQCPKRAKWSEARLDKTGKKWVVFYPRMDAEDGAYGEMYLAKADGGGAFETRRIELAATFATAHQAYAWAATIRRAAEWRVGLRKVNMAKAKHKQGRKEK